MTWLVAPLLGWSATFGAVAADLSLKPGWQGEMNDHVDRMLRLVCGLCAIAAAFAAGLVL